MRTQPRSWSAAALLSGALLAAWMPDLTVNRLAVTAAAAFVAGAVIERTRWLSVAVAIAFIGSVAVWLGVESIPAHVVIGSVGRWAVIALLVAGLGRLLVVGAQRAVTAR